MNCITHHNACDCREAEFSALKAEASALREALDLISKTKCCDYGDCRWAYIIHSADEALSRTPQSFADEAEAMKRLEDLTRGYIGELSIVNALADLDRAREKGELK